MKSQSFSFFPIAIFRLLPCSCTKSVLSEHPAPIRFENSTNIFFGRSVGAFIINAWKGIPRSSFYRFRQLSLHAWLHPYMIAPWSRPVTIVIIDNQTRKQSPSHELAERHRFWMLINPKSFSSWLGQLEFFHSKRLDWISLSFKRNDSDHDRSLGRSVRIPKNRSDADFLLLPDSHFLA